MNIYLKNLFRFIIILLLQVFVLNRITLHWFTEPAGALFVPFIFPLFILLLPFETPVWALLLLGFGSGFTVDAFMMTGGMQAAATVLMAYLRTNVLTALMARPLQEYADQQPSIKTMGWLPFLVYSGFLLLVHHIVYFSLESWSFSGFGPLLLKIGASFLTSMLFILVYVLLFTRQVLARS
ncbi:MAG: rod shape-determining protein MreD [Chitinophagia bacterium]|nr:rod shape-determining protein MreD [Chitinophagia bacterium]